MQVGLFIPCYIDQLYPQVGLATVELLNSIPGLTVDFPKEQTCCGQPMANSGYEREGDASLKVFKQNFEGFEYIVAPSGSCVLHTRDHGDASMSNRTFELTQFLVEVLKIDKLDAAFPQRVGLHESCHGLRGLRLGQASELNVPAFSYARDLLDMVEGLELVDLNRKDECCGFGGTFAITEEAISVKMGRDRIQDHLDHGAEIITGTDISCLMHLEGLMQREGVHMKAMHIAEILNNR